MTDKCKQTSTQHIGIAQATPQKYYSSTYYVYATCVIKRNKMKICQSTNTNTAVRKLVLAVFAPLAFIGGELQTCHNLADSCLATPTFWHFVFGQLKSNFINFITFWCNILPLMTV